jgi:hypothetical protein
MANLKNVTINDTGFIQLPRGTTAQRPGSPQTGMVRFNTDYNKNEVYDGAKWVVFEGSSYATGGTVSSSGGYRIHTFTSANTSTTFTMVYPGTVEVLLVGGGGGGSQIGGGGGAGGFIYDSQVSLPAGNFDVFVGAGGSRETQHNANNQNPGQPSRISSPSIPQMYNAIGGGRGSSYSSNHAVIRFCHGGSGGGGPGGHAPGAGAEGGWWPQAPGGHGNQGANHPWLAGTPNATLQGTPTGNNNDHISMEGNGYGSGIAGQGHPGGHGGHGGGFGWAAGSTTLHCGGGGGGAGSSGKPTSSGNEAGSGGSGLAAQVQGTLIRYAGGGGAGTHGPGNYGHYGLAGAQGGGINAFGGGQGGTGSAAGANGTANTGGGGGGGLWSNTQSGEGGPGVVVIRYRDT